MDLDNIQRKYGLPAPLPVVQNGKFATRFPLNLEHRGDDVFQFGGKYIGEIENIYDLLYKILTNQEIDASLALPYAIKITEDKLYVRDKTNSEWILIFDIMKPNFPKEIELYELIYKAITHQVIGEDTSYPGQFKIEENILYVRDKDNLTWTQIGDVTKEFLGATEATQAILDQVNEILTEVQELKTELNRQIATTNETLTTALQAANEAMTSAQSINIRTFNSVEEMKASNTLKAGALAKTQGFYTAGDGGGADYVITNDIGEDEADEASIIALQKGLYAKLLLENNMDIKQFGAVGDAVKDNTNIFNVAINKMVGGTLTIPSGVYLITNTLKIPDNIEIKGNAITGVQFSSINYIEELKKLNLTYIYVDSTFKGTTAVIEPADTAKSFKITNISLLGKNVPGSIYGYNITGDRGTVELKNLNAFYMSGDGFKIVKDETLLNGCTAMYNNGRGFSFYNCEDLDVELLRSGVNNQEGFLFSNNDYSRFRAIDAWGNKGTGFNIQDSKRLYFIQIQANENEKHGIQIGGASDKISFLQGRIAKNSVSENNTYSDVVFSVTSLSTFNFCEINFDGRNEENKTKYAIEDKSGVTFTGNITNCTFEDINNFGTDILSSSINKNFNINTRIIIDTDNTTDTVYNYVKYVLDNMYKALGSNIDIYFTINGVSSSLLKGRMARSGECTIQGALLYKSKCYYVYGIKSSQNIYSIYSTELTKIEA